MRQCLDINDVGVQPPSFIASTLAVIYVDVIRPQTLDVNLGDTTVSDPVKISLRSNTCITVHHKVYLIDHRRIQYDWRQELHLTT